MSIIQVDDLRYRYPGQGEDTLHGISFAIEAGEIFGFLGPSGSGKSTTQKLLIGLINDYRGRLTIMEREGHTWDHQLYQHIGVGFELPNHFSKLTGLENLQLFAAFYGGGRKGDAPAVLLERVGLGSAAGQRVAEYSKGMKMRLNFARALLNDPPLLFLDEPTAGLDPVNARLIKDIVVELRGQGKTVFLTTHNMYDADELCDRVAFIVAGELVLIDQPAALKRRHGEASVKVNYRDGEEAIQTRRFDLQGLGRDQAFLELIAAQDLESVHSQEATLEQVFIKTTGMELL